MPVLVIGCGPAGHLAARVLARRGYDALAGRTVVSRIEKAPLVAGAIADGATLPLRSRMRPPRHDSRLQVSLDGIPAATGWS